MVVDAVGDAHAKDLAHALDDRLSSGIGVLAGNRHRLEIVLPARGIERKKQRRRIHFSLAAAIVPPSALRDPHEAGRRAMAEASRAEVNADPDIAMFVLEEVDVVIAAADRAELLTRESQ